jgi:hypothetical protein
MTISYIGPPSNHNPPAAAYYYKGLLHLCNGNKPKPYKSSGIIRTHHIQSTGGERMELTIDDFFGLVDMVQAEDWTFRIGLHNDISNLDTFDYKHPNQDFIGEYSGTISSKKGVITLRLGVNVKVEKTIPGDFKESALSYYGQISFGPIETKWVYVIPQTQIGIAKGIPELKEKYHQVNLIYEESQREKREPYEESIRDILFSK